MLIIFGNACADVTYHLASLPQAGETVVATRITRDLGGKGLNQAIAARRGGARLRFIGPVGDDETARAIRSALLAESIDDVDLIVRGGSSDTSVILLGAAGENAIVSDTRQAETLDPAEITSRVALAQGDTLLLQGNLSRDATRAAITLANAVGARVVMNAAPLRTSAAALCGRVDVLIVNKLEASGWTGSDVQEDVVALIDRIDVPMVAVTLGMEGCFLRRRDDIRRGIAAPKVNAVDTTGAGDVFCGVFVAEWLATDDPLGAAELAVAAASDMVTRVGIVSALPSRDTIAQLRAARRSAA